jgi:itaconyl-CoA hydratase/mesaconyl-C4 CoA hydratase
MDGLGTDGHPSRGGFLPPAHDRNRMWAGGRVEFRQPLKVGVPAERASTVIDVKEKNGRTGALLFVTVRHEYHQAGEIVVQEEQDIVYRQPTPPKLAGSEPAPQAQWRDTVEPSPVLLFRYSAVTFNGHRIHYDHPYVTGTEGYPGLVVHGPLIATEMVAAFSRAHPKARPTHLSYRGLRPLIAPAPFQVAGRLTEPGVAQLWAEQGGTLAHQAELRFSE